MAHSKYDEVYDIRLAKREDIPDIMRFIDEYWRKGHILSYNQTVFEYEYCDKEYVHMMLAIKKETGSIEGILGFILASGDIEHLDAWGSMWKVKDKNMMFLGNELLCRLLEKYNFRTYSAVGINMKTTGILIKRNFGAYVGRLRHWYCIGEKEDFHIAIIRSLRKRMPVSSDCVITECYTSEELAKCIDFDRYKDKLPYKDLSYITKRYYEHPIFQYKVYTIQKSQECKAFFVTREINVNGSKALRLVDFVGEADEISEIGTWILHMLREGGYEYIDFYEHGFSEKSIKDAGFVERLENDENIIPNYFSPFVQKNVEIYFHAPNKNVVFCKADGDQDRPN